MNRRNILGPSAIATLAVALLPGASGAQQKSIKGQLVGTWTLVSVSVERKDGSKFDPWGPHGERNKHLY
jgi:hypothetical protein